jgi:hypothetical protein
MIDLSRCTTVKSADLKAHKKHSFEISTPETTFLLYAGEWAMNFFRDYLMIFLVYGYSDKTDCIPTYFPNW